MHTKKHGKSKSHKPIQSELANVKLEVPQKDIEKIIEDYAKQGMHPAMIGEKLKKEHKVGYIKHMMGKRLVQILKEKKVNSVLPSDMLDLMGRAVSLRAHLETNKHDNYCRTRLQRIESKILRLKKYYISNGSLPKEWQYNPEEAKLIIKGH